MTSTIAIVTFVMLGIIGGPITADAQQTGTMPRIGFLGTATPSLMSAWLTALREGLRERGYVEGQNLGIEYRWGEGKPERFPALAADLVARKVDVIVTSGPHAIRAAQGATSVIPIVMAIVEDPVEQGFVTSFARPGGNLTGLSFQDEELATRRLQMLRDALPGLVRVAALWDSTASGANALQSVKRAPDSSGRKRSSSWRRRCSRRTGTRSSGSWPGSESPPSARSARSSSTVASWRMARASQRCSDEPPTTSTES